MSKKKPDVAELVRKAIRAKDVGRRAYKKADMYMHEAAHAAVLGEEIQLSETRYAKIIDNFAGKDIVWNPCAARRWDVEVWDK